MPCTERDTLMQDKKFTLNQSTLGMACIERDAGARSLY